jgi:hypothetical protein
VCKGKTWTDEDTGDQVPFSVADLVGFDYVLDVGCADAPLEFALLSPDDLTCSEWLDINEATAGIICSEECTDTCKGVIDNVYAGCSATDTTTSSDDGDVLTAQEIEFGASSFRNDDCNVYADTKSFKTASTSAAQVISSSRIMGALLCLSFRYFLSF